MKAQPTQVRFEDEEEKWLSSRTEKTGLRRVDLVRLAVRELRKKYKTGDSVIAAMIRAKTEAAA